MTEKYIICYKATIPYIILRRYSTGMGFIIGTTQFYIGKVLYASNELKDDRISYCIYRDEVLRQSYELRLEGKDI